MLTVLTFLPLRFVQCFKLSIYYSALGDCSLNYTYALSVSLSLTLSALVIQLCVSSYRIIICYQSSEHTKHKMQGMYADTLCLTPTHNHFYGDIYSLFFTCICLCLCWCCLTDTGCTGRVRRLAFHH